MLLLFEHENCDFFIFILETLQMCSYGGYHRTTNITLRFCHSMKSGVIPMKKYAFVRNKQQQKDKIAKQFLANWLPVTLLLAAKRQQSFANCLPVA
jgi:hypothetical protein